jgi:hypothetical protein
MNPKYTWSYSHLDLFKQCPQKYYRLRVVKDVKDPPTEHLNYGREIHKVAEDYIGKGTPIPEKFISILKEPLDRLVAIEGEKHCELKLGLTQNLEPCKFFDDDVWWRGVADLLIISNDYAYLVDYKTSKSAKYADTKQLELLSLAIFKHYPQVKKIKAGLLFVVSGDLVKAKYEQEKASMYWKTWLQDVAGLEGAIKNDVWNAKPNFTCGKYCPVIDCLHNGKGH